jgi:hypothetical protein
MVVTRDLPFSVALTSCSVLSSDHLPVLINTGCLSTFHHPPDRPDVRRTDWAKFQTHLEVQILIKPELHNGKDIDACVQNLSGAILGALTVSNAKSRPHGDPRPQIPAGIQDDVRLKNRLRRLCKVARDRALKAEVNRFQMSVTSRLNEWRSDQWSTTLESLNPEDQSLWRMTKRVMRIPTPSPPWSPQGDSLSQTQRRLKVSLIVWRLSFSRSPSPRSRPLLRWLIQSWSRTYGPLPANHC